MKESFSAKSGAEEYFTPRELPEKVPGGVQSAREPPGSLQRVHRE